jgi:hypothetical protein
LIERLTERERDGEDAVPPVEAPASALLAIALREKRIGVVDEGVRAAARSRSVGGDGAEAGGGGRCRGNGGASRRFNASP